MVETHGLSRRELDNESMKDTPFEIVSKSLKRIDPQDIDDIRMAISGILQDKNRAEVILGEHEADKYMGVVGIRSITPTQISVILRKCDDVYDGSYLMWHTIPRELVEDEYALESRCMEYFTEKNNKKLQKEREAAKAKEEEDYRTYLELKKRFEKA